MNTYETMFLFDPTFGANWEAVLAEINRVLTRAEAEVIVVKRLEERRLAYEIDGRKRGLYALAYFRAAGNKITALERDMRLSESILRALVRRVDNLTEQQMHDATLGGVAHEARPGRQDADGGSPPQERSEDSERTPSSHGSSRPELVGSATEDSEPSD